MEVMRPTALQGRDGGAPGYNLRRHEDWNVTGQARPKSCRCMSRPARLAATEAWRHGVLSRGHFPRWPVGVL